MWSTFCDFKLVVLTDDCTGHKEIINKLQQSAKPHCEFSLASPRWECNTTLQTNLKLDLEITKLRLGKLQLKPKRLIVTFVKKKQFTHYRSRLISI